MKKLITASVLFAGLFSGSTQAVIPTISDSYAFTNLTKCEAALTTAPAAMNTHQWTWLNGGKSGGACALSVRKPGLETSIQTLKAAYNTNQSDIAARETKLKNTTLTTAKRNQMLSEIASIKGEQDIIIQLTNYRQSVYDKYIGYVNKKF